MAKKAVSANQTAVNPQVVNGAVAQAAQTVPATGIPSMQDFIQQQIAAAIATALGSGSLPTPAVATPTVAVAPQVQTGQVTYRNRSEYQALKDRGLKPKFEARAYYQLGASVAAIKSADGTESAYVARSNDPDMEANPIVVVGVQRQAICLNEAKAKSLYALLAAYLKAAK